MPAHGQPQVDPHLRKRLVGQVQLRQPRLTPPQVGHLQAFPQVESGV
jgi:hypothetical protein